jgi:ribosomal protein S8
MDLLNDMFARVKNAINIRRNFVIIQRSKLCLAVLNLLYLEGFIFSYSILNSMEIIVHLKYLNNKPLLKGFKRISSSSRRVYFNYKNLVKKFAYNGIFIISTSKMGLITSDFLFKTSSNIKIGGEVICKIEF